MKRTLLAACCLALTSQVAIAEQSSSNLSINSPADALAMLGTDQFGDISLNSLISDIKGDVVYQEKTSYSTGYVSVESQNSYGHFGGVDFEFKPPYNFTKADVLEQAQRIDGVKIYEKDTRVSLRWNSNEFDCSLNFDSDEKYPSFIYLCHYAGS